MARYALEDGTLVDSDRAVQSWEETTYWDGNNHCGTVSRSSFGRQTLHRSAKGRYWTEHFSQWQGSVDHLSEFEEALVE